MVTYFKVMKMDLWQALKSYLDTGKDFKELIVALDGQPLEVIYLIKGFLEMIDCDSYLDRSGEFLLEYIENEYPEVQTS
ncbi:hypothetical protein [Nostoc phage N1]|nr:hypothetical protein [Nostoc phage N1]